MLRTIPFSFWLDKKALGMKEMQEIRWFELLRGLTNGLILALFLAEGSLLAQTTGRQPIEFSRTSAQHFSLSQQAVSDGWIALFDGQTTFGWRRESNAAWRVNDRGELEVTGDQPGILRTSSQFDDFVLQLELSAQPNSVGGVLFRTSPSPKDKSIDCFEFGIGPSDEKKKQFAARLTDRDTGSPAKLNTGQFHTLQIRALAGNVQVDLNGEVVVDMTDQKPTGRGFIGLRFDSGRIVFRNIYLKPLGNQTIFNHVDLAGWRSSSGNGFRNEVTAEGDLWLTGGPGFVETDDAFGDFMLQLKTRISAGGNSGVFFRCIPGENTNGYESQIDNSVIEATQQPDQLRPANCGTGGIFRRIDARRIVATDNQWLAKTILAEGPHVAVWVNGYQVTDWTDRRKRDANPRRGLRTDAGTIMLQGHDADTTVRFREITIKELGARKK